MPCTCDPALDGSVSTDLHVGNCITDAHTAMATAASAELSTHIGEVDAKATSRLCGWSLSHGHVMAVPQPGSSTVDTGIAAHTVDSIAASAEDALSRADSAKSSEESQTSSSTESDGSEAEMVDAVVQTMPHTPEAEAALAMLPKVRGACPAAAWWSTAAGWLAFAVSCAMVHVGLYGKWERFRAQWAPATAIVQCVAALVAIVVIQYMRQQPQRVVRVVVVLEAGDHIQAMASAAAKQLPAPHQEPEVSFPHAESRSTDGGSSTATASCFAAQLWKAHVVVTKPLQWARQAASLTSAWLAHTYRVLMRIVLLACAVVAFRFLYSRLLTDQQRNCVALLFGALTSAAWPLRQCIQHRNRCASIETNVVAGRRLKRCQLCCAGTPSTLCWCGLAWPNLVVQHGSYVALASFELVLYILPMEITFIHGWEGSNSHRDPWDQLGLWLVILRRECIWFAIANTLGPVVTWLLGHALAMLLTVLLATVHWFGALVGILDMHSPRLAAALRLHKPLWRFKGIAFTVSQLSIELHWVED